MYELRIKNRSKNDLCSCEATKAVTNKAHKTTSTGFEPRSFASHHIDFMEIMVQMQTGRRLSLHLFISCFTTVNISFDLYSV